MGDEYIAVLVDVDDNDINFPPSETIWAETKDDAIAKAKNWATIACQKTGRALLIVKRPGEPGSIYKQGVRSAKAVIASGRNAYGWWRAERSDELVGIG
jgi:hypothetical protein